MQKIILIAFVTSAALLSACSDSVKDTHPQQLVSKRQAIFKKMTKTLEPMGLVARERQAYNKVEFVAAAQSLKDLSAQPWALFATDGNYPPTRALPEVWSKPGEFKQAQDLYMAAVEQLVRVADSGDLPVLRSSVEAVQKSCKTCHDKFRTSRAGD